MGFVKLKEILGRGGSNHPALKKGATLAQVQQAFQKEVLALFPASKRPVLQETLRVAQCDGGAVVIEAADAQSATVAHMRKTEILKTLQEQCPEAAIQTLSIRRFSP